MGTGFSARKDHPRLLGWLAALMSLSLCAILVIGILETHRIWQRYAARSALSILLSERTARVAPVQEALTRLIDGGPIHSMLPKFPYGVDESRARAIGRKVTAAFTHIHRGELETAVDVLSSALSDSANYDMTHIEQRLEAMRSQLRGITQRRETLRAERDRAEARLEGLTQRQALNQTELRLLLGVPEPEAPTRSTLEWYTSGPLNELPVLPEIPEEPENLEALEIQLESMRPADWKRPPSRELTARLAALREAARSDQLEVHELSQALDDGKEVSTALNQTEAHLRSRLRYIVRDFALELFPPMSPVLG